MIPHASIYHRHSNAPIAQARAQRDAEKAAKLAELNRLRVDATTAWNLSRKTTTHLYGTVVDLENQIYNLGLSK